MRKSILLLAVLFFPVVGLAVGLDNVGTAISKATSGETAFGAASGALFCFDYPTNAVCLDTDGSVMVSTAEWQAPSFAGTAAASSNAFSISNDGARLDLGPGADDYLYASSNTIHLAGNAYADGSLNVTTNLNANNINGIGDATVTAVSVKADGGDAFKYQTYNTYTSGNVFCWYNNATEIACLDYAGVMQLDGNLELTSPNRICLDGATCSINIRYQSGYVQVNGTTLYVADIVAGGVRLNGNAEIEQFFNNYPVLLTSKDASDGAATAFVMNNENTLTTTGDDLVVVRNNGTDTFAVDKDGMLRFGIGNTGAAPTCSSAYRNKIWVVEGGAGVTDTVTICLKAAADTYSWVPLVTGG